MMSEVFHIATITLDANLHERDIRLQHAETRIQAAVNQGATVIVLPDFLTTGYHYRETLYDMTEKPEGETLIWMRDLAHKHGITLIGAWLIHDIDQSYHTTFVCDAGGNVTRYDRHQPYLWERVFYRGSYDDRLTVVSTPHGRIGLISGFDCMFEDIYYRYAGRVDCLIITATLPNWREVKLSLSATAIPESLPTRLYDRFIQRITELPDFGRITYETDIPIIVASNYGTFNSYLPASYFSVKALMFRHPQHQTWIGQSANVHIHAPMMTQSAIYKPDEIILSSPNSPVQHAIIQAPSVPLLPKVKTMNPFTEWLIAVVIPFFFRLNYMRGVRRQWGARNGHDARWLRQNRVTAFFISVISFLVGLFLGIILRRK